MIVRLLGEQLVIRNIIHVDCIRRITVREFVVGFGALLLLTILAVGVLAACSKSPPEPLVGPGDWTVTGTFPPHPKSAVNALDVPKAILANPDVRFWRSWSPETNSGVGTITTAPFSAPSYLAIPYFGSPAEADGVRIFLRCTSSLAQMQVATSRTNADWATAYMHVPRAFCSDRVQLVAETNNKGYLIGVATPVKVPFAFYVLHTTVFVRLLVILATWLLCCGIVLAVALQLPARPDASIVGFATIGGCSMLVFIVCHFSPIAAIIVSWLILLLFLLLLLRGALSKPGQLVRLLRISAIPGLLWLLVAVSYICLVGAIDNGGGEWAVNGAFSPARWSSDNQLPYLFAEALHLGHPRSTIGWGQWQASDRPPLLAAFLLIPRSTFLLPLQALVGRDLLPMMYQVSAATLMASWAAAIYLLVKPLGRNKALYVVVLAFVTPFFLFNTVYIWPKLLGAIYAVLAMSLLLKLHRRSWPGALSTISACCALSLLSHGSTAFVLLPMLLYFVSTIFRCGLSEMAKAFAVALACLSPWLWWQTYVQPHGNALLQYAALNSFGFDKRTEPLWPRVRDLYQQLGFYGWLELKAESFSKFMLPSKAWWQYAETARNSPGADWRGVSRVWDFFIAPRSLGIGAVGLVYLVLTRWARKAEAADALILPCAVIGLSSVLLPLLATMYEPITHSQPYGGLVLLFVAGAIAVSVSTWRWPAAAIAAAYMLVVWVIHPLQLALRLDWTAICLSLAAAICAALLVRAAWVKAPQRELLVGPLGGHPTPAILARPRA